MQCKTCGYAMTPFETDCPRCAKNALTTAPQPEVMHSYPSSQQSHSQTTTPHSTFCTICNNPSVQKVSAIVHAGTWQSHSVGTTVGVGQISGGANFGLQSTTTTNLAGENQLASLLKPPAEPERKQVYIGCLGAVAVFLATLTLTNALLEGKVSLFVPLVFGGLSAILFYFHNTALKQSNATWEIQNQAWQEQMQIWNRLYYCPRCDTVYDPPTNRSAPTASWIELSR